jgi:hypothetical protein
MDFRELEPLDSGSTMELSRQRSTEAGNRCTRQWRLIRMVLLLFLMAVEVIVSRPPGPGTSRPQTPRR